KISTEEVCPTCKGTGKVNPTILITDEIERDLRFIVQARPKSKITLRVHPFLEAYLKKGWRKLQRHWLRTFKKWVRIEADSSLSMLEYKFYDGNDDEIRLT
ncbi:MAG: ribonuclease E/G, partial [Bacteroidetes bacterium]